MIFKSIDDAGIATVLMSREEANVFARALVIAKLEVGDDIVLGAYNTRQGIKIDQLRSILGTIMKS